jgi:hypothetical protein
MVRLPKHTQDAPLLFRQAEVVENPPKPRHDGVKSLVQHHRQGTRELIDGHGF